MPHAVTVGTGLDAWVHALEACTGVRRQSVTSAPAQEALRLVREHLPRAAADGNDRVARQAMQEAAFLAGIAIDHCGTGVAHSIGHALGTLYHLPHGVSVVVGMRAALDWNVQGSPDAFGAAAQALECAPEAVPHGLTMLCEQIRLTDVVRGLPSTQVDAAVLADTMAAPENQPMLHNNARPVDEQARAMLAERTVAVWDELVRG
jgi:alcohol dehydrogenase class IV